MILANDGYIEIRARNKPGQYFKSMIDILPYHRLIQLLSVPSKLISVHKNMFMARAKDITTAIEIVELTIRCRQKELMDKIETESQQVKMLDNGGRTYDPVADIHPVSPLSPLSTLSPLSPLSTSTPLSTFDIKADKSSSKLQTFSVFITATAAVAGVYYWFTTRNS
jgi:hypothetical protein